MVYLGADQTKSQQGVTTAIEDLSLKDKKALRMIRFTQGAATTVEALEKKREEEERKLKRAEKFGLITKEAIDQKRSQRAIRFGLEEPAPMRKVTSKQEEKI